MKIRRLGFDLDNVIADMEPYLLAYAKEKYGIELTDEQKKFFKWEQMPGMSQEIAEDIHATAVDPAFFMNIDPVEGAKETLSFLKRKGRKIHIITARPEDSFVFTSRWLKKHRIWYHSLTCCPSAWKPRMAAELKVESFVDDRYETLMGFINFRQTGRFRKLGLMSQNWNAHLKHDRLRRVHNWEDILELLEVKGRL
jgi:uncharacterized HAD superfamily protein